MTLLTFILELCGSPLYNIWIRNQKLNLILIYYYFVVVVVVVVAAAVVIIIINLLLLCQYE